MKGFYSEDELDALRRLKGTDRDVEARMPVKITRHYYELARNSPALQRLVKASPSETLDLAGAEDPGHQMDFSPVEGLLHKYEMGLLYVVSTCSAHCRFCYREELIARKEVERADGTVGAKGLARIPDVIDYIRSHNRRVQQNGGRHPASGREKLREILKRPLYQRWHLRQDREAVHAGTRGSQRRAIQRVDSDAYPDDQ